MARVQRTSDRYEIYDGDKLAGFTQFRMNGELVAFVHTEVDPAFEGHGLGSELVRAALEDSREQGREVLPFCPFVNGYIQRHPEWEELIPPAYRRGFATAVS
jgi:predicted GNAT family acetyltransferase